MRESVIEKWERLMESEGMDLVELDIIVPGLPKNYYKENVLDTFMDAVDWFCYRQKYSERTAEEMVNTILIRDAYYKMLEREGLLPTPTC